VDLGGCAIVRFRVAAVAAFLILRLAAAFCFVLAIVFSDQWRLKYWTARS
jgi:hypothetical protein